MKVKVIPSDREMMSSELKHLGWFWLVCLWSERKKEAMERTHYSVCRLNKCCQSEAEVKSNYIVNVEK